MTLLITSFSRWRDSWFDPFVPSSQLTCSCLEVHVICPDKMFKSQVNSEL